MTPKKLMVVAVLVALAGIGLGLVVAITDTPDEVQAIGADGSVTPGEESRAQTKTVVRTVPGRTVVVSSEAKAAPDEQQPDEPSEPEPEEPEVDEEEPEEPETDLDGDGHPDGADNCTNAVNPDQADYDGDGHGDACDADDDNDGLTDVAEGGYGTNPYDSDSDGDGWHDGSEVSAGTDPLDPSSYPVLEPCFNPDPETC